MKGIIVVKVGYAIVCMLSAVLLGVMMHDIFIADLKLLKQVGRKNAGGYAIAFSGCAGITLASVTYVVHNAWRKITS